MEISKRNFLVSMGVMGAVSTVSALPYSQDEKQAWTNFKYKFISKGQVIDTGNANISHSEGQGIGLLASVYFNDRVTFEEVLAWTNLHLKRGDGLFSWKWENSKVPDANNASDADIYIAWALVQAALKWREPEFALQASVVLDSLVKQCVKKIKGFTLLLPGALGFETSTNIIVNPSYYVLPAFKLFYQLDRKQVWLDLISSAKLIFKGWGSSGLPSDWISMDKATARMDLWAERPPRFGYEAIRVPIFLLAIGDTTHTSFSAYLRSFATKKQPAWVDLATGQVAEYLAPSSFYCAHTKYLTGRYAPVQADGQYYDYFLEFLCRASG